MEDFHRLLQVSSGSSASGGDENGSVADSALDGYSDQSKGDTAVDDRSIGETTAARVGWARHPRCLSERVRVSVVPNLLSRRWSINPYNHYSIPTRKM